MPPSPEDVEFALRNSVGEVRAVSPRGMRYSVRPGRGQSWTPSFYRRQVLPALRQARLEVHAAILAGIRKGSVTPKGQHGDRLYWDAVWKQVASVTGIRYQRSAWRP